MRSRGRLDADLELALLGVEELDDAGGDLDLMGGQKPALRAPAQAADAAAMRPPDTVIPDGLNPFEIQEAYRAEGSRAPDRDLRRRRCPGGPDGCSDPPSAARSSRPGGR